MMDGSKQAGWLSRQTEVFNCQLGDGRKKEGNTGARSVITGVSVELGRHGLMPAHQLKRIHV